jgi:class 3 adenylate cyclase
LLRRRLGYQAFTFQQLTAHGLLIERKLTTIFSADVVGYGRLMGQDEGGTLATLRTYREVMAGLIAGRRGRVVNTAGDSLLAEFPSVVQAVECAVQVQREVAERNGARRRPTDGFGSASIWRRDGPRERSAWR